MRKPNSALVYPVYLSESGAMYLLLKRKPGKILGDFWQGVTGGQENDETILETASRELVEETGFCDVSIKQVPYTATFPIDDRWQKDYPPDATEVKEFTFLAFINGMREPNISGEHTDWKWLGYGEARSLLSFNNNKLALDAVNRTIIAQSGFRD